MSECLARPMIGRPVALHYCWKISSRLSGDFFHGCRMIKKIKLKNFKKFSNLEFEFDESLTILIGDNESGKSTILSALDLAMSGSRSRIESLGLESLFNLEIIAKFFEDGKDPAKLPELSVEIYLDEANDLDLNGKINSEDRICDGLRLSCVADPSYAKEIKGILDQDGFNFPFEYYSIAFKTFSGKSFNGHSRPLRHLLIDSSQIGNEYATRGYVRGVYSANVLDSERGKHQNEYRKFKNRFQEESLKDINKRVDKFSFAVKKAGHAQLESDLTISEGGVTLENRGKGRQCVMKAEFALAKPAGAKGFDLLLLEEPENHLSHTNMKMLIGRIAESTGKQLILTTHSNLVCSGLDLRKCVLLNVSCDAPASLNDLSEETAEFFMKAPNSKLLQLILSTRVILVEGDAELVLLNEMFSQKVGKSMDDSGVHGISVGGTSFKRYLEIAKLLGIQVGVLRDNDKDYQVNCVSRYEEHVSDRIKVFSDVDNERYTFEVCMYGDNKALCEALFAPGRKTLSVQDYMLKNKVTVALALLRQDAGKLTPPKYCEEAFEWINQ